VDAEDAARAVEVVEVGIKQPLEVLAILAVPHHPGRRRGLGLLGRAHAVEREGLWQALAAPVDALGRFEEVVDAHGVARHVVDAVDLRQLPSSTTETVGSRGGLVRDDTDRERQIQRRPRGIIV